MIGGICKTCKHWTHNRPSNKDPDWGDCDMFSTFEDESENPEALARAIGGGSGCYESAGNLETHFQFGCVQWEPKE